MGYAVTESTRPHARDANTASRSYHVIWDGLGERNVSGARQAVYNYLSTVYGNSVTGAIRVIPNLDEEEPGANDLALIVGLHGLPLSDVQCTEIEGSDGKRYLADVSWAKVDKPAGPTPSGVIATITDDDATVTVTRSMTATARSRDVDYAPLYAVLRSEKQVSGDDALPEYRLTAPYDLGLLDVVRTSVGGEIDVRGLKLNPPSPNYVAGLQLIGGTVKASFVKNISGYAAEGVLNSDAFTLGGIAYEKYELLFVEANVSATKDNATQEGAGTPTSWSIELGFAVGDNKYIIVEPTTGDGTTDSKKSDLSAFSRKEDPYWWWPYPMANPTTDTTVGTDPALPAIIVSPHDYVWRYIEHETEGGLVVSEATFINFHRPYAAVSFQTLFGATSL